MRVGAGGTLLHCWWECKLVQPRRKSVWRFVQKLKIDLPDNPGKPLLDLYLRKCKSTQKTDMFTTALSTQPCRAHKNIRG
jgi:hypothetical protein